MATTICAYCKQSSHMTVKWGHQVRVVDGNTARYIDEGTFTCDTCGRASLALVPAPSSSSVAAGQVDLYASAHPDGTSWLPATGAVRSFADVPEPISSTASEAFACASIGAHRAAILLARTTIEATAKAKNITSGSLVAKIAALKDANLIRPDVADAANEVRLLGNDMAHGDNLGTVASEESEEILELMADVLEEVFQAPARLAARRAKRLAAAK
jgi:hypothetical protein